MAQRDQNTWYVSKTMHQARVQDVERFISKAIDRRLTTDEKKQIDAIPDQILHLLSAAIIELGET